MIDPAEDPYVAASRDAFAEYELGDIPPDPLEGVGFVRFAAWLLIGIPFLAACAAISRKCK